MKRHRCTPQVACTIWPVSAEDEMTSVPLNSMNLAIDNVGVRRHFPGDVLRMATQYCDPNTTHPRFSAIGSWL